MRIENITQAISFISETCFPSLTPSERLFVLSNLILKESLPLLPEDIKKDGSNVLSSGKRIVYEQLQYQDNIGLKLGFKAHQIIKIAEQVNSGAIDE